MPFVPSVAGLASRGANVAAKATKAARAAKAAIPGKVMHHGVPRAVLKQLDPEVAKVVRGARGRPNRRAVDEAVHRGAHSGTGRGGDYSTFWRDELRRVGDPRNATVEDVERIRARAMLRFFDIVE